MLLHSDENYYNSKRSNNQSFQNFIRILIVVFLGAFISNTSWNSLHAPALAYIGAGSLVIAIILNIFTFRLAQTALEESREATHKTYNENDVTYINQIPRAYRKLNRLMRLLIVFLLIGIVVCPISYIYEKSVEPKEVTQMAKKPQSTQQPSQRVGTEKNERLWDTPSRPITPTPDTAPAAQPAAQPTQPAQRPAQPAQPAAEPASNPQSNTEKDS